MCARTDLERDVAQGRAGACIFTITSRQRLMGECDCRLVALSFGRDPLIFSNWYIPLSNSMAPETPTRSAASCLSATSSGCCNKSTILSVLIMCISTEASIHSASEGVSLTVTISKAGKSLSDEAAQRLQSVGSHFHTVRDFTCIECGRGVCDERHKIIDVKRAVCNASRDQCGTAQNSNVLNQILREDLYGRQ